MAHISTKAILEKNAPLSFNSWLKREMKHWGQVSLLTWHCHVSGYRSYETSCLPSWHWCQPSSPWQHALAILTAINVPGKHNKWRKCRLGHSQYYVHGMGLVSFLSCNNSFLDFKLHIAVWFSKKHLFLSVSASFFSSWLFPPVVWGCGTHNLWKG